MRRESHMDGFRDAIRRCQLVDMRYVGNDFTWTDNREDEVRCWLIRALANNSWLAHFPLSKVCHLNPSKSDHLPLVVEIRCAPMEWP